MINYQYDQLFSSRVFKSRPGWCFSIPSEVPSAKEGCIEFQKEIGIKKKENNFSGIVWFRLLIKLFNFEY